MPHTEDEDKKELPLTRDQELKETLEVANSSDPVQQHNLGMKYFIGHGVKKSESESFFWYCKAAESDFSPSQFKLGELYYYGRGTQQNEAEAIRLIRLSAEQKDPDAQNFLGMLYREGRGEIIRDEKMSLGLFRAAAEQKHPGAIINLGKHYQTLSMFDNAFAAYQRAANLGDYIGQYYLALMYRDGRGVTRNNKRAIELLESSLANAKTLPSLDFKEITVKDIHTTLGNLYHHLNKEEAAFQHFLAAAKINRENIAAFYDFYNQIAVPTPEQIYAATQVELPKWTPHHKFLTDLSQLAIQRPAEFEKLFNTDKKALAVLDCLSPIAKKAVLKRMTEREKEIKEALIKGSITDESIIKLTSSYDNPLPAEIAIREKIYLEQFIDALKKVVLFHDKHYSYEDEMVCDELCIALTAAEASSEYGNDLEEPNTKEDYINITATLLNKLSEQVPSLLETDLVGEKISSKSNPSPSLFKKQSPSSLDDNIKKALFQLPPNTRTFITLEIKKIKEMKRAMP